jgi:hypothetical protein
MPLLPSYTFMSQQLIKHRGNLTFISENLIGYTLYAETKISLSLKIT